MSGVMLVHRRFFSSTPAAFAKRRQIAIQRKKANIARQTVLKAEREPANFDPIRGTPTDFTRSLLSADVVWSPNTAVEDSLHFSQNDIQSIQTAVEAAAHARRKAEPTISRLPATPSTTHNTNMEIPDIPPPNTIASTEDEILSRHLSELSVENARKSAASSRIVSLQNSNARTLRAYNTAHAIREFGRSAGDTGSAEVQAAILTTRILAEAKHIAANKKDVHGYRGFRGLVHQRQKILKYLRQESVERYTECIKRLGLDDQCVVREITM